MCHIECCVICFLVKKSYIEDIIGKCSICPCSRQTRLPFPIKSPSFSTNPFDLVHMDVWGPYKVPTCDGQKWFLTIEYSVIHVYSKLVTNSVSRLVVKTDR